MTLVLQAALPLAILVAPLSVAARTPAQEITVIAPSQTQLRSWTTRVGQAIDAQLRYPARLGNAPEPEGIVDVTFMCGPDGAPTRVALARSSGSNRLDRAGLRAVKGVGSLHPLPEGIGADQMYRAQLLFAVDDGSGRAVERVAALRGNGDSRNDALMQRRSSFARVSVGLVPPAAD